jgi:hypothetical protein
MGVVEGGDGSERGNEGAGGAGVQVAGMDDWVGRVPECCFVTSAC